MCLIRITPSLLIDLTDELAGYSIINMSIGADHQIYLLLTSQRKRSILQTNGSYVSLIELELEFGDYAEPINSKSWVLIDARTNGTPNAYICDNNGNPQKTFLVGDSVNDVQVTAEGSIWVSYSDSGFFDNPKLLETSSGFVASRWSKQGIKQYLFLTFLDCYAMNNVSNDETWLYTYPDFPLTQIINDKILKRWHSEVKGSLAFAIWQNYVMFCGSYENKLIFSLYELHDNKKMNHVANYQFFNEIIYIRARGSKIIGLYNKKLYQIDLRDIISNL